MDNLLPLSKQALAMFEELKFLAEIPLMSSPAILRLPTSDLQNNVELCGAYAGSGRRGFCLFMTSGVLPAFIAMSRATTQLDEIPPSTHGIGGVHGVYNRAGT